MFKRAVITDEISQDLGEAIALAREYKLDAVELRNVWGQRVDQLDDDAARRAAGLLQSSGLAVAALASPYLKCNIDSADEYREHLKILKSAIRMAKHFGTPIIRTFTFWKDGRPLEAVWDRILELYAEPVKIAGGEGVILGIENESSTFIATGEQLARFLGALGSPAVKAVWDSGNAYYDDLREGVAAGYQAIKDQLVHVHIKDCAPDPETGKLVWVRLGEGQVGIAEELRLLAKGGYTGYVSLETHYRPKANLAEDVMRLPSGQAFSELGAQGSAECLANWDQMMARLA